MPEEPARRNVRIEHPNREKASSKATKAIVVLLLLASAGLMALIAVGGWSYMTSAKDVLVFYILVYALLAFYAARWTRGSLPISAALAILLVIFAAIAGPQWFARDKPGFNSTNFPADLLGILTLVLIPLEFLVIVFSMRGFQQEWNIEVEKPADGSRGEAQPAAA